MAAGEKVVVFDIGNVLVEWDPRHLYRKMFANEDEVDSFLADICPMEWNLEQDRGRSWADGVRERVALFPDWETHIRAYAERWNEMVPGVIEPNMRLFADIKASGRPVYGISNVSHEKYAELVARYPLLGAFDGLVISAAEKLLKPDPDIYRVFLRRYGLEAQDCIFIDDSLANIKAAQEIGFTTIHYAAELDVRAALASHGYRLPGV